MEIANLQLRRNMFTFPQHVSHLEFQESEQFPEHFGMGNTYALQHYKGFHCFYASTSDRHIDNLKDLQLTVQQEILTDLQTSVQTDCPNL